MSNNILRLKGPFVQKRNSSRPGPPSLPANSAVSAERVRELQSNLAAIEEYWKYADAPHVPLVAVRYERIIPKSRRIRKLLMEVDSKSANDTVVGVRFHDNGHCSQHVITHCVSLKAIRSSIINLAALAECIEALCPDGVLTSDRLGWINKEKTDFSNLPLSRSAFSQLAVDVCHIDAFVLNDPKKSIDTDSMVTLYKGVLDNNTAFLRSIGVSELNLRTYDDSTFLLTPDQYKILYDRAPQLIAMALKDMNDIPADSMEDDHSASFENSMSLPSDEPWIGVLDTPFNKNVYFSDWVESETMVDSEIVQDHDFIHGTCVSSIIVDGPYLNPMLDDECGRFRVRHVGIAVGGRFSSFTIIREIENAVIRYPEVKVWNLSLGSVLEVPDNFISGEAAMLDRIQSEHDVIFVIAGTNDSSCSLSKKIGSPADSVNSLVVNSVRIDGSPCSYSRKGPVLSFFGKPDVAYYGGDYDQKMSACCEGDRIRLVAGTSFSAPWIARKLAYLIHIIGLEREVAKALLIDSACGWEQDGNPGMTGYGIVPRRMRDILSVSDNEIKFVLSGTSELFDTYTHNIPVPVCKGKHPYYVKATLCYFPHCERNQGVDYTSTELSLSFGRIKNESIQPINNNLQDFEGVLTYEEEARKYFRKWDNVKHVSERLNPRGRAKESYGDGLWGISLKTKERLEKSHGAGIRFGLVITLRAMDNVNRIDEFIQRCSFRTWIVSEISVENQIDIFNAANQDIEFE